jgi:CrcB protein
MNFALPWTMMLAVASGAAIGAVLRWAAGVWMFEAWYGFPLATVAVNCVGGFLIGVAFVGFGRWPSELAQAFFITGFLGGLTTFSAFSGESFLLLQRGQLLMAVWHASAHVFGALASVAAGFGLARLLLRA